MAGIICADKLTFEYVRTDAGTGEERRTRALDGICFSIEEGSFTAVTGPNGSGKSTLAKCLNGILLPSSGSVTVRGMDTADDDLIWDIRSTVGMVFQNPDNQIVSSVVEDDVAFGPENLCIEPEEIRRRVDSALKQVGMYEERKKGPHMLSGGQKQRVAIAGAIAMDPDCIVFDEPTAMLDPQGRRTVMEIIKRLNADGKTIVLITHFMEEAAEADRIIALKDGRMFMDDTPAGFFSDASKVREAGLDLPAAVDIRDRLSEMGLSLPDDIVTGEELVDQICRSKQMI
jgi:energy-coupling factor transporter ATPase